MIELLILIFTVLAGVFKLRDARSQIEEHKRDVKNAYRKLWSKLDKSSVNNLPDIAISYLFSLEKIFNKTILLALKENKYIGFVPITFGWGLVVGLNMHCELGLLLIPICVNSLIICYFIYIYVSIIKKKNNTPNKYKKNLKNDKFLRGTILFVTGYYLSFSYTHIVIFIEGKTESSVGTLKSWLLISNTIFDLATIFTTIIIFKFVHKKMSKSIYYILAILVDICIAGCFSFLSMWIVTLKANLNLDNTQILNILFLKNKEGTDWFIDEWFWLIHSTFIPTIVIMLLILGAIFCKLLIIPLSKELKRTAELPRPDHITCCFFGVIAAILALVKYLIENP